jgi:hypothetical protein
MPLDLSLILVYLLQANVAPSTNARFFWLASLLAVAAININLVCCWLSR